MAPSQYDWKIVDWDVKPQHNQPTNPTPNTTNPNPPTLNSNQNPGQRASVLYGTFV